MDVPNGICDQLLVQHPNPAARKAAIQAIIQEANSRNNLVFFKKDAEGQKGAYTDDFVSGATNKLANPATPFALLAVKDYLDKTKTRSIQVAQNLDRLITTQFGQAHANVETKWNAYLAQVDTQEAVSLTSLQQLQATAVAA
jgi:hypothetical protein